MEKSVSVTLEWTHKGFTVYGMPDTFLVYDSFGRQVKGFPGLQDAQDWIDRYVGRKRKPHTIQKWVGDRQ